MQNEKFGTKNEGRESVFIYPLARPDLRFNWLTGLLAVLFLSGFLWAEERPDSDGMFEDDDVPESGSVQYQFQDALRSGDSPDITDHRLIGQWRVKRTETDTWTLSQSAGLFHTSETVSIPETGVQVPQDLWSVRTGAGFNRRLGDRRAFGLHASVGSASDALFNSLQEISAGVTASYRMPSLKRNAWLFFLTYSNNRHFLNSLPLPGFAYYAESTNQKLRALIGFPFVRLLYQPSEDWDVRVSIYGPRMLNAELGRRCGKGRLYGEFQRGSLGWMRADRSDSSGRLIFSRMRLLAGVKWPVFRELILDLAGGREFDRRFFENDSSRTTGVPTLGLQPSSLISA